MSTQSFTLVVLVLSALAKSVLVYTVCWYNNAYSAIYIFYIFVSSNIVCMHNNAFMHVL